MVIYVQTKALGRPLESRQLPLQATFLLQPLTIASAGARHQVCLARRLVCLARRLVC